MVGRSVGWLAGGRVDCLVELLLLISEVVTPTGSAQNFKHYKLQVLMVSIVDISYKVLLMLMPLYATVAVGRFSVCCFFPRVVKFVLRG